MGFPNAFLFCLCFPCQRVNLKTNQEIEEDVTLPLVYEEFQRIAEKHKIDEFRSMVNIKLVIPHV